MESARRLDEIAGLALAIGLDIVFAEVVPVRQVRPATLLGSGQIENIRTHCTLYEAELVVVDGALSAIQQRNLEENLKHKVIDRTGLILEIFGERAVTAEGRIQVELAHLDYQQSRLVRSWTHLERQRGGFGFLGGPGETQIEADRRLIRQRMGRLRKALEQVRKTRELHRRRRGRAPWPVVALVGYTNAGKSTLFNHLTHAGVMAEDLLFATLDPTMRAIEMPGVEKAILSDTVGFISDLPTQLVAAFRATLEEVVNADIIVHVRDMASPNRDAQKRQVMQVLADLGVQERGGDSEDGGGDSEGGAVIIEAWNKSDMLNEEERQELFDIAQEDGSAFLISAVKGEGVDGLMSGIGDILTQGALTYVVEVPASAGRQIAWLYANGAVVDDVAGEREGMPSRMISVKLGVKQWGQYCALDR